ncbi:MAG TPA: hypothetical protein VGB30_00515 [bacterium]|jgi:hypothetical protein
MARYLLILALIVNSIVYVGCADMLNQQKQKDKNLAHMVEENLKTADLFREYLESFSYESDGVYKAVLHDIPDAETAGRLSFNMMVVLEERNNTKVKTGRPNFTINAFQNGAQISKTYYVMASGNPPMVTLMGQYEGEVWTPNR